MPLHFAIGFVGPVAKTALIADREFHNSLKVNSLLTAIKTHSEQTLWGSRHVAEDQSSVEVCMHLSAGCVFRLRRLGAERYRLDRRNGERPEWRVSPECHCHPDRYR